MKKLLIATMGVFALSLGLAAAAEETKAAETTTYTLGMTGVT
jgi:hypothetical protein